MTEEAGTQDAKRHGLPVRRVGTEPAPVFYANFAEVKMSVFDLGISFGQVRDVIGNELQVADVVSVMMSPQHAKSLFSILSAKIESYEKRFGPIPIAPVSPDAGEE